MNITVIEKRPKEVNGAEGEPKAIEVEKVEHIFETHACELIESAEKRFRKQFYGKPDEELTKAARATFFGKLDTNFVLPRNVVMRVAMGQADMVVLVGLGLR